MAESEDLNARLKAVHDEVHRNPTIDELARRAVARKHEMDRRLNSPDPAVRAAAEQEIIEGGVAFIMDTRLGGP